jgi:hypothetical protein
MLSRIYKKRTANTEEEIREDLTINKSFSVLTFSLSSSSPDQYSPLSYPHFAISNATLFSSVFSSHPDYCHFEH